MFVMSMMLVSFKAGVEYQRGDVDYLLFGTWPEEPVTPPDTHEYVDLGLPSGTLWATVNVGATRPNEFGDYFAWGETEPKEEYDWNNYKWCNGSENTMTKYCSNSSFGIVDNKIVFSGRLKNRIVYDTLRKIKNIKDKQVVTIIYGKDTTEDEKVKNMEYVKAKFPFLEFGAIDGGQAVYKYLIAVE